MNNMKTENIIREDRRFAVIIRNGTEINHKEFISLPGDLLQIGFFKLNKDEKIEPHEHKINKRVVERTQEVIYLLDGKLKVKLFDKKIKFFETILNPGDMIILLEGGHSFEMIDKSKFFEIKQGPFTSMKDDKEKFGEQKSQ